MAHPLEQDKNTRWEFRAWVPEPSGIAARFAEHYPDTECEARTDLYLQSGDPDFLPKLRCGVRLEVKHRLETRGGLDLWTMPFADDLPLSAAAHEMLTRVIPAPARLWPVDLTSPGAIADLAACLGTIAVQKARTLATEDDL